MKKLLLEEVDENQQSEFQASNLISALIKTEWDSVDLYNSILLTATNDGLSDVVAVLNDIVSNHYVHIGQLEGLLGMVNDNVDSIEDGQEMVDDLIS